MATKSEIETRKHEHQLDLDAQIEEVWKAITDPSELVRWFPRTAAVQPGKDGTITYGWADDLEGTLEIKSWEPPHHLETSWIAHAGPENQEGTPLAVDWFLEGEGGRTRLRLVHSGFDNGAEWDEEFESTRRGWNFELFTLQHYLRHHRGKDRTAFWVRRKVNESAARIWRRLCGAHGVVTSIQPEQPEAGGRLELTLSSGDLVQGKTIHFLPPLELACTAENLGNGVFRMGYENCAGPEAHIWVSLWEYPARKADLLEKRLLTSMDRVFE